MPSITRSISRISSIALVAAAATLAACEQHPIAPPSEAAHSPDPAELRVQDGLPELVAGISHALGSPDVRSDILAAMRRSHRVEHGLLLRPYLASPLGAGLLAASAQTLGVTEAELLDRVDALGGVLGELEVSVPFREQRLTWTGTARVAVAGSTGSDEERLLAHEPSGLRVTVDEEAAQRYDAFLFLRPRESFGTRIGRQADVPGSVIQDPDDGELAIVGTWKVDGQEAFTVDYGSFDSEDELRDYLEPRLASLVEPPSAAVCAESVSAQNHCHGGGGRRPRNLYVVTYSSTFLYTFTLKQGTEWGTEEVEITVGYGGYEGVTATKRYTGVSEGLRIAPDVEMLAVSPAPNGTVFNVSAVETDRWRNDDLGSSDFGHSPGGKLFELDKIDIDLIW